MVWVLLQSPLSEMGACARGHTRVRLQAPASMNTHGVDGFGLLAVLSVPQRLHGRGSSDRSELVLQAGGGALRLKMALTKTE